ncbi:putative aldouronate transport system permease protein [Pullulanibacillus pueri]|uniref:Maltose ABC transporter permease n=1 Tax=Pullulanibacillus pueri TaxID=1437324 RepID=A0A8J3EKG4_9BACL|nr:carbohydrate ABC transporter permease [Pullulanibacillus pueri]MBM7681139.1 putative aldouronate transport system permease protein [Pullulanibacillus pueri]GGH77197.1 maltose ABC transporter permease [Pullulanibacillus pueri]
MVMKKWSIFSIINYTLLALFAFCTLYPFIYILAYSLSDGMEAMKHPIYFFPKGFTFQNYIEIFQDTKFLQAYKITILRTVIGTALHVFLCALFAYALTKKTLPGRSFFTFFIFIPTLFGGGMIPTFVLYRELGLIDSFWVYVIPFLYNFFNIIVLRTFFQQLPTSLEESAKIDGCGDFKIFIKIILPLSAPVLATIGLFIGVFHWNDWFTGTYFVTSKNLLPVQTLLNDLLSQSLAQANAAKSASETGTSLGLQTIAQTTPESLRMATLMVATLPILCVYPFLQKYFVKGVMIGSVKG